MRLIAHRRIISGIALVAFLFGVAFPALAIARQALDLGFHISFSGILTFKNAIAIKEAAQKSPLERILVETDSPYLAPAPHRGKPNEPAFVRHVAEELARLRGLSLEQVAEATTANFFNLFKHASRPIQP